MSELRKEYQAVLDKLENKYGFKDWVILEDLARACQRIADKPPIELNDEELSLIYFNYLSSSEQIDGDFGRKCIAAHIAKQLEPPKPIVMHIRMAKQLDNNSLPYAIVMPHDLFSNSKWVSKTIEVLVDGE